MASKRKESTLMFDWEPGGFELLTLFLEKIKKEGGTFALWSRVRWESQPKTGRRQIVKRSRKKKIPHQHQYARFILDNWKTMSIEQMAKACNSSIAVISRVGKALKLKREHRFYIENPQQGQAGMGIELLNLQTGIYYDNATQAAASVGMLRKTLINQVHRNKSKIFIKI